MDLDKFAAIARARDWLEEPLGFSMDVDHAVYTESKVFKMDGKIAEDAQFVSRRTERKAILYEVTVGDDRHGHRATFRIVGARAAGVVARYEQIMRDDFGQQPPRG